MRKYIWSLKEQTYLEREAGEAPRQENMSKGTKSRGKG
jgi:hypothetical protein